MLLEMISEQLVRRSLAAGSRTREQQLSQGFARPQFLTPPSNTGKQFHTRFRWVLRNLTWAKCYDAIKPVTQATSQQQPKSPISPRLNIPLPERWPSAEFLQKSGRHHPMAFAISPF